MVLKKILDLIPTYTNSFNPFAASLKESFSAATTHQQQMC
jgi:hypothetical protein